MKNKMMKTAGLVLASISMLMANGVVASENKSIEQSECPSFHCVNYISGLEVTKNYKGEIASISVNRNSESKTGEVTTFTSQDGTLEIRVTERDDTEKEEFVSSNNEVANNNIETTSDYRTDPTCNEPVKINQYVSKVVCDGYITITKQKDISMFDKYKAFIQPFYSN